MPPNASQPFKLSPDYRQKYSENARFLKDNLNVSNISQSTVSRFRQIYELLLKEKINKHDQGHQWRSTMTAVMIMREMNFPKSEILPASAAAMIHDIGYIIHEEVGDDGDQDGYMSRRKARFKKHALNGAKEAEERLGRMLSVIERGQERHGKIGEVVARLRELLSYKDEEGEWHLPEQKDVQLIIASILNHNDYGKETADDYHPERIPKPALAVQIGDKLDNCRARVYKEHMVAEAFIPDQKAYDSYYYHRSVPYCIQNYETRLDREAGELHVIYYVNLSEFKEMVQARFPDFNYSQEQFEADFIKAYEKSCKVAAEAAGVILGRMTDEPTLQVEFKYDTGDSSIRHFSRPNRESKKRAA